MKDPCKLPKKFEIFYSHAVAKGSSWIAKPHDGLNIRIQHKPKHGYQFGLRIVRNK
jgi:hypothetical protein